jgi:hypothetical protein
MTLYTWQFEVIFVVLQDLVLKNHVKIINWKT